MIHVTDEEKINEIIDECNQNNADIFDGAARDPARVRSDAKYIFLHRHCGITVETLCMMMTDLKFAFAAMSVGLPPLPGVAGL